MFFLFMYLKRLSFHALLNSYLDYCEIMFTLNINRSMTSVTRKETFVSKWFKVLLVLARFNLRKIPNTHFIKIIIYFYNNNTHNDTNGTHFQCKLPVFV